MREKHRYIAVESGHAVTEPERDDFATGLRIALMRCIGESNFHMVNPRVVEFLNDNTFILRTSLAGCGHVIAALALIKRIGGRDAYFYTLGASGTIKALKKKRM